MVLWFKVLRSAMQIFRPTIQTSEKQVLCLGNEGFFKVRNAGFMPCQAGFTPAMQALYQAMQALFL